MKSRRVMLTIEVETDAELNAIHRAEFFDFMTRGDLNLMSGRVIQIQANVIKPTKGGDPKMANAGKGKASKAKPKSKAKKK